jgi:hypothetical protein
MTSNPQRKRSAIRRAEDRSRITNCARFLPDVDGRSARGRRFRDLVEVYLEKTGGRQQDLCRQLATLVMAREDLSARLVRGEAVSAQDVLLLSGTINRTTALLGLNDPDPADEHRRREREDREAGLIP